MSWAQEIRAFRARTQIKQEALAEKLGVSQAYVSKLEGGGARPVGAVAETLRQLLDQPDNRPLFDHFKSAVNNSPHLCSLFEQAGCSIRFIAVSQGYRDMGYPMSEVYPGGVLDERFVPELRANVARMIEDGIFDGRIACCELLWMAERKDGYHYWRSVNTPVKSDAGIWFLHHSALEVSKAQYDEQVARQSGELYYRDFQGDNVK